jgi:hypothetical protein
MSNVDIKMSKLVEQLDNYRPDQQSAVQAMQKALKTASLKKNLGDHPAFKLLLKTLRDRERQYSLILSNKEDLEEIKRHAYFARRGEVRWILSFFDVDQTIESIEKTLDEELDGQLGDNAPSEE